uniref:Secreted protein n=1 Tax=Ascaris lumbricoides TaxID=6252 RepID=A0A0M3IXA9_ASCLU
MSLCCSSFVLLQGSCFGKTIVALLRPTKLLRSLSSRSRYSPPHSGKRRLFYCHYASSLAESIAPSSIMTRITFPLIPVRLITLVPVKILGYR